MGQEGDVHPMHSELLLPELKAGFFLIQLCHGLLQLSRVQGKNEQAGPEQHGLQPKTT